MRQDPLQLVASDSTGVVQRAARREANDAVTRSLDDLSADDREILILCGIEQHPYEELSSLLGVAAKTLTARYWRVLERLRKQLPGSVYEKFVEE